MTKGAIQKYTDTLAKYSTTGAVEIPTNSDLNTPQFTAVGSYYIKYNADAVTLSNSPTGNAFCMVVKNVVGSDVNALGGSLDGYRVREIITYKDERWTQQITYFVANGTPSYGAWKRELAGAISTSGNRFDVFPYTSGANTAVGKFVDFYVEDAATSPTTELWAPNTAYDVTRVGDLRIENKSDSTRSGTVLTSGITAMKQIASSTITSLNGFAPVTNMDLYENDKYYYLNIWGGKTTAALTNNVDVLEFPKNITSSGGVLVALTDSANIPFAVQV